MASLYVEQLQFVEEDEHLLNCSCHQVKIGSCIGLSPSIPESQIQQILSDKGLDDLLARSNEISIKEKVLILNAITEDLENHSNQGNYDMLPNSIDLKISLQDVSEGVYFLCEISGTANLLTVIAWLNISYCCIILLIFIIQLIAVACCKPSPSEKKAILVLTLIGFQSITSLSTVMFFYAGGLSTHLSQHYPELRKWALPFFILIVISSLPALLAVIFVVLNHLFKLPFKDLFSRWIHRENDNDEKESKA